MSVGFQIIDRGWAEMMSRVSRAGSARVRAGVIGAAASETHGESGITTGEIALIQEYGSDTIPARPFVKITFESNQRKEAIKKMFVRVVRTVVFTGMSADVALDMLGEYAANAIKETIRAGSGVPPPNAPSTIAKKGSDHTLIDTGEMVEAVSHEVVHGGNTAALEGSAATGF